MSSKELHVISIGAAPRLKWIGGGDWEMLDDYDIIFNDEDDNVHTVVVPAGFITDGPSVPKRLSSFFPTRGPTFHASIFHDWLYSEGRAAWEAKGFGQYEADLLFWKVCRCFEVSKLTSFWGWLGVSLGGASKYHD